MAGQGSARVTLREIDQSLVRNPQLLPQGIPAAVVGTARKGPAFVPQTFANMQQFSETFGSMLERGEEGNSQRVGPLALNEWMRNAQAGTFLRVLGVGNGLKAIDNFVEDAGFEVGKMLVQKQKDSLTGQLSDVGKRGNNPHAFINPGDEVAAEAIGRTHFLGCFMQDRPNSSFLQDAGIQLENSPSSITIRMKNSVEVSSGSTLTLNYRIADGTEETEVFTFTFNAPIQDEAAADATIRANAEPGVILKDLADAINSNNLATTNAHLTATLTKDIDPTSGLEVETGATLVITSAYDPTSGFHSAGILNTMSANFDLRAANLSTHAVEDIVVGGETSLDATQEFFFAIPNAQAAEFAIEAVANPADTDTLQFTLITNNGSGGLSNKEVTYTFTTTAIVGNSDNKVEGVYEFTGIAAANVQIVTNDPKATLRNLKSAIDRIAADVGTGAGHVSNHEGVGKTLLSVDGSTLTIQQKVKGETGRSKANGADAPITATPSGFKTFVASDHDQTSSDENSIAVEAGKFMFGGVSGESDNGGVANTDPVSEDFVAPEITIAFTALPAEDDEILINFINDADDTTVVTSGVKFVNSLADNGAAVALSSGTGGVNVHVGIDVQEMMVNLKNAIKNAEAGEDGAQVLMKNSLDIVLNDDENSITIKQRARDQGSAPNNTESRSLTKVSFKIGNQAVFTNPDGESVTGNSSKKTALFSGAGGGAAPVIRGILMTPQGVKAAINPNSAVAGFHDASDGSLDLQKVSYGKEFGTTQTDNLAGYVIGDVDSASQGFKLLLNGFTNSEKPGVLDCSFDPASSTYFSKVLNTDPTKIEEFGHYLYAHWDVNANVARPSNSGILRAGTQLGGNFANMIGFCLPANDAAVPPRDFEDFQSRFRTAQTPWIVSQFYSSADSSARPATLSGGDSYKLFKLHSLDDGVYGNERFRLLIENVRYESAEKYGSFDVVLEKFDSNPIEGEALVRWKNVNLNPSSRNFIARVIGDQHVYYDFDKELDKQRLVVKGEFEPKNKYVRVEIHPDVLSGVLPKDILPVGFQGHAYLNTTSDDSFIEPVANGDNRIYLDSANVPTDILVQAKVLPLDYVQNISRSVGTTKEADSALAWGVKVGYREEVRGSNSELTEQVFNKSLSSWTKFFPDIGGNPAWERDSETNETFQNSFFSLEKIEVQVSSDAIDDDWSSAQYIRASAAPASGKRFVNVAKDAKAGNVKYLKFRCLFQGGFDGVNIFDDEKANLTSVAAVREGQDETGLSKLTGPTILAYQRAIDVLTDKSATEFQLLAIPGQRSPIISDYAIDSCEDRFDALYLMDIIEKDSNDVIIESSAQKPHVRNTIKDFSNRVLNTSFAASYFPDVSIRKTSDRSIVDVPPSVGMIGVMSQSDALADPWFAPAGLSRGRLVNALDAKVQMNRDLLDELYDADINPLYVPAGRSGEVYAFGQKTLLQSESALDRINVRRLLIDIRRKVKAVGEQLLFEPNRASTLAKFSSLVEPIMANVQKRRGVTRYKVQIDTTTTTQNDIENNTIRGKVYLQPTKSVEFISLDFVVTNTID